MNTSGPINPYPGIRPYKEKEDYLFFGREKQLSEILRTFRQERFVVIAGAAGSGKTSLMHAGLLSGLLKGDMEGESNYWHKLIIRPHTNPFYYLAGALAQLLNVRTENNLAMMEAALRAGSKGLIERLQLHGFPADTPLFIGIDQLEDLIAYSQCNEEETDCYSEFIRFFDLLVESSKARTYRIYIAGTLDSGFIDHFVRLSEQEELLNRGFYFLTQPDREALRHIIKSPAAIAGADISDDLVNKLIAETENINWPLPGLQSTLSRIFQQWRNASDKTKVIGLEWYKQSDALAEAFHNFAEEVYHKLPEERRNAVEKLFKSLTYSSFNQLVGKGETLRRLSLITDINESLLAEVIEHFRQYERRLLLPDPDVPLRSSTTVELAHDSMIEMWQRLKTWAEQEQAAGKLYRQLRQSAVLYQQQKEGLWENPDLQYARDLFENKTPTEAWAARYGGNFAETKAFLDESIRKQEMKQQEEEQQQEDLHAHLRKNASKLRGIAIRNRWLAIGAIIVAAIALAGAIIFHIQKVEINRKMVRSESDMFVAYADNNEKQNPTRALNFAYKALREDPENPAAYGALVRLFYSADAFYNQIVKTGQPVQNIAFHSGKKILAAGTGNKVTLYKPDGTKLYTLPAFDKEIRKLVFPGNKDVLTILYGLTGVAFWDITAQTEIRRHNMNRQINAIAPESNNNHIYLALRQGLVKKYSWERDALQHVMSTGRIISAIARAPKSGLIACGCTSGHIVIFRENGQPVNNFAAHNASIWNIQFSPDGKRLVTTSGERTPTENSAKLWNLKGELLREFKGKMRQITNAVFTKNGKYVFTSAFGGLITQWDMQGNIVRTLKGHDAVVNDIVIPSDTAGTLYSASGDMTGKDNGIKAWNFRRRNLVLPGNNIMAFHQLDINASGKKVVTGAHSDKGIVLTDSLKPVFRVTPGNTEIIHTLWMEGQDQIAIALEDGTVLLYSHEGRRMGEFSIEDTALTTLAWSETGNFFVAGGKSGIMRAYMPDGRKISKRFGHKSAINALDISRDGQLILSACNDSTAALWTVDGEKLITYAPNYGKVTDAAFSPYSEMIITASTDNIVRLWTYKGKLKNRLQGHKDKINEVGFSTPGEYIYTASDDYTLRLWNTSGEMIARLHHGLYKTVLDAEATPSGDKIITACKHYMNGNTYLMSWNIKKSYILNSVKKHFALKDSLLNTH